MLTIEVNDAAIVEVLNRAAALFDNTLPLYQSIGQILLAATKDRFAKGESPEGQKWQPKSPVTKAGQKLPIRTFGAISRPARSSDCRKRIS